jgi:hypothetical protein
MCVGNAVLGERWAPFGRYKITEIANNGLAHHIDNGCGLNQASNKPASCNYGLDPGLRQFAVLLRGRQPVSDIERFLNSMTVKGALSLEASMRRVLFRRVLFEKIRSL